MTEGPILSSIETEQQILGAVLSNNDRYHEVSGMVKPEFFHEKVHGAIWQAISDRIERDLEANAVTMAVEMEGFDGLTKLGGTKYFVRLAGGSISAFAIKDYVKDLITLYQRRTMVGRLSQLVDELEGGASPEVAAADLEMMIHEREAISTRPRSMSLLKAQEIALRRIVDIREGKLVGVPTGMKSLEAEISFTPKRFTLLAGSTSMGKTALGIYITYAAAKRNFGVGFVSREMPEEDLVNRINAIESRVPYNSYDQPMSETILHQVADAAHRLQNFPIRIFSDQVKDIPSILSEAKRLKQEWKPNGNFQGLKVLVVDYIQLLKGRGRTHSRAEELAQIANEMKDLAKILDVHIFALAQVDRNLGDRDDPRPRLNDLRGSGDLEMAPDNVVFIHRPSYYLERKGEPKDPDAFDDYHADLAYWKNKAELIIGKARMGQIGITKVGCDMATNRFWDLKQEGGWDF